MHFTAVNKYGRTRNLNSEGKRKTVIAGNFSEILIEGKEIQFELAGNSSYPGSSYRDSTVQKTFWFCDLLDSAFTAAYKHKLYKTHFLTIQLR